MNNLMEAFSVYSMGNGFMLPVILVISFIAGIIASLSPCSIGILPLIAGYVGGYSRADNKRLFLQMLFFSLGLASVLSIIGVICALSGKAFTAAASPAVILIFASIIVILGLNLLGFIDIQFPALIKKLPQNKNNGLVFFPFLIGALFALASSPCASPILASIMAFAAVSSNVLFSIALLFCFAIGQCVIVILFAMFTQTIKHAPVIAKYSEILMKICGVILVITGLYIWYSIFSSL